MGPVYFYFLEILEFKNEYLSFLTFSLALVLDLQKKLQQYCRVLQYTLHQGSLMLASCIIVVH